MNELERYQRAVGAAQSALRDVQNMEDREAIIHHAQDTLIYIDKLLNPPPEVEEMEVSAWAVYHKGVFQYLADHDPEITREDMEVVKLTGTRKVAKPQPRERSAEGKVYGAGDGRNNVVFVTGEAIPVGTPVTVTWPE